MQVNDDDDLHSGQRSSEVKCGKLCPMVTKLDQKNHWCKFIMMMTFMEVKGHQRSNVVNYGLWLPNLVRRIPDVSLRWWWPNWRSKIIRGQMWYTIRYGYHIWSKYKLKIRMTFIGVKGQMRSNIVNYVPWLQTWSADHWWQWWPS